jgi:hypothetical protein
MSESNGESGAQSFSRVTDRRQFLEFTGTPCCRHTYSIIPLALTSKNVLTKHTSHGRGEGDKSKSRVDTTSIIQHHHGQLSFFAVTSISLF